MKNIFIILLTTLMMSVCVFAENESDTFTLTEYLGISDCRETVESIYMYSERTFNGGADMYVSPDVDVFLTLADSIILTDVEDTPMAFYEEGNITPRDSLFMEVHSAEGKMTFALISALGEVDKYGLMMSRLPATDCVTEKENFQKLEELYDELMKEKREELSEPYKSLTYGEETIQTSEDKACEEAPEGEKEPHYNGFALAITALVMTVAVAATLLLTKKENSMHQ